MAGGIDEVEDVVLAVLGVVAQVYCPGLDGDAPLPLDVHVVQQLFLHIPAGDRLGVFEDAVGQGGFAVVNVGDDRKIANIVASCCHKLFSPASKCLQNGFNANKSVYHRTALRRKGSSGFRWGPAQPHCPAEIPPLAPEQAAQKRRPPPPRQRPVGEWPDGEKGKDQGNDQLQNGEHLAQQGIERRTGAIGDRKAGEAPPPGDCLLYTSRCV